MSVNVELPIATDDDFDLLFEDLDNGNVVAKEKQKAISVKIERQFFVEVLAMTINGDSYDDIAKIMGLPIEQIDNLARKFRRKGFRWVPVPASGDFSQTQDLSEVAALLEDFI